MTDKITMGSEAQCGKWSDIATAPRDGSKIDVWVSGDGRYPDTWREKDRWVYWGPDQLGSVGVVRVCENQSRVTHWMPRPAEPTN
jgi:hypothetical protein